MKISVSVVNDVTLTEQDTLVITYKTLCQQFNLIAGAYLEDGKIMFREDTGRGYDTEPVYKLYATTQDIAVIDILDKLYQKIDNHRKLEL